jgi:hypothetical protein
VTTYAGRNGVINKNGEIIIDTIHEKEIFDIGNNLFIIGDRDTNNIYGIEVENTNFSLLNRDGNTIIPCQKYKSLVVLTDNSILCTSNKTNKVYYHLFDKYGKFLREVNSMYHGLYDDQFERHYDDSTFGVNTEFFKIKNKTYCNFYDFEHGKAIVQICDQKRNALIDTNGVIVFSKLGIKVSKYIDDDCFLFCYANPEIDYSGKRPYGIMTLSGEVVLEPIIDDFGYNSFINGLILVNIGNKTCYLNRNGKIIWAERKYDIYNWPSIYNFEIEQ